MIGVAVVLLGPLIYPLEHPPEITASFGEYRLSHHHAGLDLGTGGDETVRVRAAAAGTVYRIRRAHNGYGRALYVRHADGKIAVYGHLSAFAPKLEALVREAKAWKVDRRVRVPVAQGEHLGWVGSAGTDLVHLHFELRDGDPVNPLTNGLEIPDTLPPKIVRLLLVPEGGDGPSGVDAHEAVFDLPLDGPLVLAGEVALYVDVRDRVDGSERDLRPYEVELRADLDVVHVSRYERLSYSDDYHVELDYHGRRRAHGEGVFHRLSPIRPRPRVHVRSRRPRWSSGAHELRIRARDAAGNEAEAMVPVLVAAGGGVRPSPPPGVRREVANGASFEVDGLRVEVGEEALFRPYPTWITNAEASGPGLESVTPLYRLTGGWTPAHGASVVSLEAPRGADLNGAGLYLTDNGDWWRLGARWTGRRAQGRSLHLTGFAIMRDVSPPELMEPVVDAHPGGPRLILPYEELGGVLSDFELSVDGEPVLFEFQSGQSRFIYRPEGPVVRPRSVRLTVTDRGGWTSEAEWVVELPGPP